MKKLPPITLDFLSNSLYIHVKSELQQSKASVACSAYLAEDVTVPPRAILTFPINIPQKSANQVVICPTQALGSRYGLFGSNVIAQKKTISVHILF